MTGSALLGHPPNNKDDSFIVKGFFRSNGIPDKAWKPTSVIPIKTPPGASHDSRKGEVVASFSVILILVTLITGTRLALRLFRRDLRWGLDDYAMTLAYLGVVAFLSLGLAAAASGGCGKHLYDLTYAEFNIYISLMWAAQTVFYPVLAMIKISIVLFNRRLTGLTSRTWMMIHSTFLVLLVGYIIASITVNLLLCMPFPKNFSTLNVGKMANPPRWLHSKPVVPTLSAIHIAFDFALLAVPLIVLYQLKMSLSKKIRLGVLFSVGAVSTIGAVMRAVIQHSVESTDLTYYYPEYVRWTLIDVFFATTVASLPTLNNLIPKRWDHSHASGSQSISKNTSGAGTSQSKSDGGRTLVHERSQTLFDMEHGRKLSGDTGVESQPDWNEYHPEMKLEK